MNLASEFMFVAHHSLANLTSIFFISQVRHRWFITMVTVRPVFLVFLVVVLFNVMEARPRLRVGKKFDIFRKSGIPGAEGGSFRDFDKCVTTVNWASKWFNSELT